jgi:hypothetical protein
MSEHDQEQQQPRIPQEWRRQYHKRPLDKLPGDITIAFDRIEQQRRDADKLRAALLATQGKLGSANTKVWVLMLIVLGEGAVISWLVKMVLAHFVLK